jgi:hypothetical protein
MSETYEFDTFTALADELEKLDLKESQPPVVNNNPALYLDDRWDIVTQAINTFTERFVRQTNDQEFARVA